MSLRDILPSKPYFCIILAAVAYIGFPLSSYPITAFESNTKVPLGLFAPYIVPFKSASLNAFLYYLLKLPLFMFPFIDAVLTLTKDS
jgi:hypothetical protein